MCVCVCVCVCVSVCVCVYVCVCVCAVYIHKRTRDLLIYDDLQVLGAPEWDILLVVRWVNHVTLQ